MVVSTVLDKCSLKFSLLLAELINVYKNQLVQEEIEFRTTTTAVPKNIE